VQGVPPLLATALLMVMTPALGFVLARMRLETGSVWPAVALHAAGILTALALVVAAVVYSRGRWTILRQRLEARDSSPAAEGRPSPTQGAIT
jgi:membrane protease YdiL (CAAX protease family)